MMNGEDGAEGQDPDQTESARTAAKPHGCPKCGKPMQRSKKRDDLYRCQDCNKYFRIKSSAKAKRPTLRPKLQAKSQMDQAGEPALTGQDIGEQLTSEPDAAVPEAEVAAGDDAPIMPAIDQAPREEDVEVQVPPVDDDADETVAGDREQPPADEEDEEEEESPISDDEAEAMSYVMSQLSERERALITSQQVLPGEPEPEDDETADQPPAEAGASMDEEETETGEEAVHTGENGVVYEDDSTLVYSDSADEAPSREMEQPVPDTAQEADTGALDEHIAAPAPAPATEPIGLEALRDRAVQEPQDESPGAVVETPSGDEDVSAEEPLETAPEQVTPAASESTVEPPEAVPESPEEDEADDLAPDFPDDSAEPPTEVDVRAGVDYHLDINAILKEVSVSADVVLQVQTHLKCGKNVLLYGPPGSGKTSLVRAMAAQICRVEPSKESSTDGFTAVTASAEWGISDFLGRVESTGGDDGSLMTDAEVGLVEAARRCANALETSGRPHYLIIEKLHRADVEGLAARLNDIIDSRDRLPLLNAEEGGGKELRIPEKFRIISTFDTYERDVLFRLGTLFQGRFVPVEMEPPEEGEERVRLAELASRRRR